MIATHRERDAWDNLLSLAIGAAATLGIGMLTSVVIARQLQPRQYGMYAVVVSLAGLIRLGGDWGIRPWTATRLAAHYARQQRSDVSQCLAQCLKILLMAAGLLAFGGSFVCPLLAQRFYGERAIGLFAGQLCWLGVTGIGYECTVTALEGTGRMRKVALLESVSSGLTILCVLAALLIGAGVQGVVLGTLLASALSSVIAAAIYHRIQTQDRHLLPTWWELLQAMRTASLREAFPQGLLTALDKHVTRLYDIVPILLLGAVSGSVAAGYYKIAAGVAAPWFFIVGPVARNLAPRLAAAHGLGDEPAMRRLFVRSSLAGGMVSVGLAGALALLAPLLLALCGKAYGSVLLPLRLLLISYAFIGFGVGFGPLFRVLNRVPVSIAVNVVGLAMLGVAGRPLIQQYGLVGAVWLVIAIEGLAALMLYECSLRLMRAARAPRPRLVVQPVES